MCALEKEVDCKKQVIEFNKLDSNYSISGLVMGNRLIIME